jgi:biopolymer transport protein ExbD
VATKGLDVHEGLIVSIRRDLTLAVGEKVVSSKGFEDALRSARASERPVFLKADQSVPYGTIVEYIARMRRAGVAQLGLVTEPARNAR